MNDYTINLKMREDKFDDLRLRVIKAMLRDPICTDDILILLANIAAGACNHNAHKATDKIPIPLEIIRTHTAIRFLSIFHERLDASPGLTVPDGVRIN
jgi:hypothetical protein